MLNGSSIHKSKGQEPIVVWDSWGIGGLFYNIYICEWWKDQINTISNSTKKKKKIQKEQKSLVFSKEN